MQGIFKHGNLPKMLLHAREVLMVEFRPVLKEAGISEPQWRVLRALTEYEQIDAVNLARKAQVLAPSLTRMLRLLEEMQLIVRRVDNVDMRRQNIWLSESGRELVYFLGKKIESIYVDLERYLGSELIENAYHSVSKLITAVEQYQEARLKKNSQ